MSKAAMGSTIYKGLGEQSYSPHVPLLDRILGEAIAATGRQGCRQHGHALWGSLSREQALEYAKGNLEEHLVVVEPHAGTVVTWTRDVSDLVMAFSSWLRDQTWCGFDPEIGSRARTLMLDIQGDVETLETYLLMRRQGRAIREIATHWVRQLDILEWIADPSQDPPYLDHTGEVWINGPVDLVPYADFKATREMAENLAP